MAHENPTPPRSAQPGSSIVGIVLGVALMLGGMFVQGQVGRLEPFGVPFEPGKTVAAIGVLLILFPVIKLFYTAPLEAALQERNSSLMETFGEAEALRTEMQALRTSYEARLAETEAQARETINAQLREAQSIRQTLMNEASQKAETLVTNAQAEVAAERTRLLTELRTHVTDLALSAAERVVGENMDTERNRRIVDDFIANAEPPTAMPLTSANVAATPSGDTSQNAAQSAADGSDVPAVDASQIPDAGPESDVEGLRSQGDEGILPEGEAITGGARVYSQDAAL